MVENNSKYHAYLLKNEFLVFWRCPSAAKACYYYICSILTRNTMRRVPRAPPSHRAERTTRKRRSGARPVLFFFPERRKGHRVVIKSHTRHKICILLRRCTPNFFLTRCRCRVLHRCTRIHPEFGRIFAKLFRLISTIQSYSGECWIHLDTLF